MGNQLSMPLHKMFSMYGRLRRADVDAGNKDVKGPAVGSHGLPGAI